MRSDKIGLTWQQQIEYNKVSSFGRDLNNNFKITFNSFQQVRNNTNINAQELIDKC